MKKLLPLLLGTALFASHAAKGAVYTFDSSVTNWYTAGLTPTQAVGPGMGSLVVAHLNTSISSPPYNRVSVVGQGTTSYFPTPTQGSWAGVLWNAPTGEYVTSIRIIGSFRDDGGNLNFNTAIYGGDSDAPAQVHLSSGQSFGTYTPGNASWSYDWTLNPTQEDITTLQFRTWNAATGTAAINAGNLGYAGNISYLQITTALLPTPVPEPSTAMLLIGGGLLGGFGWMRRRNRC